jgi:hypothetical protein
MESGKAWGLVLMGNKAEILYVTTMIGRVF